MQCKARSLSAGVVLRVLLPCLGVVVCTTEHRLSAWAQPVVSSDASWLTAQVQSAPLDQANPDLLMEQAAVAFQRADYAVAVSMWSRVIAVTSGRDVRNQALINRAKAYLVLNQPALSIADLDRCEFDPRDIPRIGERLLLKGTAQLQLKQYQEAVNTLTQSERFLPNSAAVFSNRAVAYQALRQFDAARRDIRSSLKIDPSISNYYNLAVLEKAAGNYRECFVLLTQIVAQRPAFVQVYVQRGLCAASLGRHDESISDMLKALKLDPANAEALEQMGVSMMAKGQKDAARSYLEKAASLRLSTGQVAEYSRIMAKLSELDGR